MKRTLAVAAALAIAPLGAAQDRPPAPAPPPGSPPPVHQPQERKLVAQFDKNADGWLNAEERKAAREFLASQPAPPRRAPRPGIRARPHAQPGPRLSPADAKTFPDSDLYEPDALRTFFFEFESPDWEAELADFYNTDVEVPATLVVDGKRYPNVGVHLRGSSSYFMVPPGYKRSLGVSIDFVDKNQLLYGHRTLNLLNAHGDPSFLSAAVYSQIARRRLPTPKVNFVKVAINGESWGVYVNVQQVNRDFLEENYKELAKNGARWKVKGRPNGRSGLDYLGEALDPYQQRYELKSGDPTRAWKNLIALCRTLSETPLDRLEAALEPILDIEAALWFLALEVALINTDGYWTRASDYYLFQDAAGKFHVIPYDFNESFQPLRGDRAPGFDLDPLAASNDPGKPLRSRLLAVPGLRAKYLRRIASIAADDLDWKTLGPVVDRFRSLLEKELEADTRKLNPFEAFRSNPIRAFAERRREYLLAHPEIRREY